MHRAWNLLEPTRKCGSGKDKRDIFRAIQIKERCGLCIVGLTVRGRYYHRGQQVQPQSEYGANTITKCFTAKLDTTTSVSPRNVAANSGTAAHYRRLDQPAVRTKRLRAPRAAVLIMCQ